EVVVEQSVEVRVLSSAPISFLFFRFSLGVIERDKAELLSETTGSHQRTRAVASGRIWFRFDVHRSPDARRPQLPYVE
ncbi:MAG TPA: hypothetical protein VIT67_14110, partial [Povalibacter sp.]